MKVLVLTLLFVAVFVVGSLFVEAHIRDHTKELMNLVDRAMENLETGWDFDTCAEILENFTQRWDHVHDGWETVVAHARLTTIDAALVMAKWSVANRDMSQAQSQLGVLRLQLKHLYEHYSISLENLL
jgi:hypothetical protein